MLYFFFIDALLFFFDAYADEVGPEQGRVELDDGYHAVHMRLCVGHRGAAPLAVASGGAPEFRCAAVLDACVVVCPKEVSRRRNRHRRSRLHLEEVVQVLQHAVP